jgi:hypothetical protein
MSVQSGPSVAIAAFGGLPEQSQKQHLENDAQRDRMAYELESKQIETEAKEREAARTHQAQEREAQRAHELAKWQRVTSNYETGESRAFWFTVGCLAAGVAGVVALFASGHDALAGHLANTIIAGGLGYQGGKSAGLIKANKNASMLPRGQDHKDDKDDNEK